MCSNHNVEPKPIYPHQPLHRNKSITSSGNTTKISIVVLDIILHLQIKIRYNNNLKVVNYYINNN